MGTPVTNIGLDAGSVVDIPTSPGDANDGSDTGTLGPTTDLDDDATSKDTPAPTSDVKYNEPAGTPVPTFGIDDGGVVDTPSSASDLLDGGD